MSHSEHNQTRRRLIKGIGALLLLSVSPVGLAATS